MLELRMVLNMLQCLSSFLISLNMSEFTITDRVLNIYHTIHSTRSLFKLRVQTKKQTYSVPGQRSKMKRFEKIIIITTTKVIITKNSILNLWSVLNMCLVLNMSEFWIFVNLRIYDRVMNMSRDVIMEEFWIFQDSEYARFLHMQAVYRVLNMVE